MTDIADTPRARLSTLSRSIAGQTAIVTGAASGMGRATAHLFADEGARVVVADLGAERVAAVVDEIAAVHGPDAALGVVCDVADLGAVARAGRADRRVGGAARHRRQQRRGLDDQLGVPGRGRVREQLGAHARRQPHRPRPADPPRGAAHDRGRRGPHRQHRVDRGDRDDGGAGRLRRDEGRRRRADQEHGRRTRPDRHHRQLHLSRPDRHRA